MSAIIATETAVHWCYRCSRLVGVLTEDSVACPYCDGGFLEAVDPRSSMEPDRRFADRSDLDTSANSGNRLRRGRRANGDRSPFNPVIVMQGQAEGGGDDGNGRERNFELYYEDGSGSGLQPLPEIMSDFLMVTGFDRLLEQLAQMETNGLGRSERPAASKSAVESMPTIEILDLHVETESHCAVCKEAFSLGSEAREMPCKHIYHSDCILPWLSLRNSCPVCRLELPTNTTNYADSESQVRSEEDSVGLTVWRLPGGGFAVGRFSGGTRTAELELPVVFTEMDGGFNNVVPARRITLTSRRSRTRGGGFARTFRNIFSFFGRSRSPSFSSSSTSSQSSSLEYGLSINRSGRQSSSVVRRFFRRGSRT